MTFHSEYQWQNAANPPSYLCHVGNTISQVPCFYSTIGLAVSTDQGKTFQVAGEIAEPSQPLSVFETGAKYMDIGDGSLVVADASGRHLDNPPADPSTAYFYLFFEDSFPGLQGACAVTECLAVARDRTWMWWRQHYPAIRTAWQKFSISMTLSCPIHGLTGHW